MYIQAYTTMAFFLHDTTSNNYEHVRSLLISNPSGIESYEKEITDILVSGIQSFYKELEIDFNAASELSDYWIRYAPRQRGKDASNEATPWGEVGEKVLDAYMYRFVSNTFEQVRFIGLPYGHDIRFMTEDAFIHIDVKSTGPNDSPDDIVLSLNQITGDGITLDQFGVKNSMVIAPGPRREISFQPELPPFYIYDNKPRITLTFYLKCKYEVYSITKQPLLYLELICVPNGLIMFDTLQIKNHRGLFAAGKDRVDFSNDKRVRIKLNPLSEVAKWRCSKISNQNGRIIVQLR